MARLPKPGGDDNQWGNVLNEYLGQAHNADGTAKDASGSTKGVIRLAGDLGGSADSPTVPPLAAHINATTDVHGITNTASLEVVNRVFWDPGDWSRFTQANFTNGGQNTITLSEATVVTAIDSGSNVQDNSANQYGRMIHTGVQGNDRTVWTLNEAVSENSEIVSRWRNNAGQVGHVHRVVTSGGFIRAYTVWQNVIFGAKYNILIAVWESPASGTTNTLNIYNQGSILGFVSNFGNLGAARSSNVVTVTLPPEHGVRVGDQFIITASAPDATLVGTHTVTSVGFTSLTFNHAGSDGSSFITAKSRRLTDEYWVKSRLQGNRVSVKVWLPTEREPYWGDPYRTTTWVDSGNVGPTGKGGNGIYSGHFSGGSTYDWPGLDIKKLP